MVGTSNSVLSGSGGKEALFGGTELVKRKGRVFIEYGLFANNLEEVYELFSLVKFYPTCISEQEFIGYSDNFEIVDDLRELPVYRVEKGENNDYSLVKISDAKTRVMEANENAKRMDDRCKVLWSCVCKLMNEVSNITNISHSNIKPLLPGVVGDVQETEKEVDYTVDLLDHFANKLGLGRYDNYRDIGINTDNTTLIEEVESRLRALKMKL